MVGARSWLRAALWTVAAVCGVAVLAVGLLLVEPVRRAAFAVAAGLPWRDGPAVETLDLRTSPEASVALIGDLYLPSEGRRHPTVLIRTPYGRTSVRPMAALFAERGYAVVLQDVRGTGDSDGAFEPFVNEAADGRDTVRWIRAQPWSNGKVGAWGPSYLAFVQWAILDAEPGALDAIVPIASMARNYPIFYPSGVFSLGIALQWTGSIHDLIENGYRWPSPLEELQASLWGAGEDEPRIRFMDLPVASLDERSFGRRYDFYRTFVASPTPDSPYWRAGDHSDLPGDGLPPAHLVVGWRDFCLETTLEMYERLRDAGAEPHLTIGDFPHTNIALVFETTRLGLSFFDRHLRGRSDAPPPPPVRYYVYGADEWREAGSWPIASRAERWYLRGGGELSRSGGAGGAGSSTYTYDPRDPTPAIGGPRLLDPFFVDETGLVDRADVLTFTSAPLPEPLEIVGRPRGEIVFQHSAASADLFARLSRVGVDGVSRNITDTLVRVEGATAEARRIAFTLPPTAIRLDAGERLRVVVASGAHPRYTRNLGIAAENQLFEETIVPSTQRIFHGRERASWIELPIPAPEQPRS